MKNSSFSNHLKYSYLFTMGGMALLALLLLRTTAPVGSAVSSRPSAATRTAPPVSALSKDPAMQAKLIKAYGNLPLSFEANQGQAGSNVKFLARGQGYNLLLTGNEAVLAVRAGSQMSKGKRPKPTASDRFSMLFSL